MRSRNEWNLFLSLQQIFETMKIKEVVSALEKFAPLPLQDDFDNAGLQVGLTDAEVTGALLCVDVTEAVMEEAIGLGCNLIVAHHPLLFKSLKSITGKTYVERCVLKAVKNDITVYAAHTNLDNAMNGVNFKIAEKIGMKNVRVLEPKENTLLKLVAFVPAAQADEVRRALFDAGCGNIGNYDSCSYNVNGEGTFRAAEGAHPFCGKIGELHREAEVRIETVLPYFLRSKAEKALLEIHPYEEPVYDFYALQNEWPQTGSGIIGDLDVPMNENDFLRDIKKKFEAGCVKHSRLNGRLIRRVALCGGAGAFLLPKAVGKADAFLTGEIRYHDYFFYENDMLVTEIGHYESEQYTKEIFQSIIRDLFPSVEVYISRINTNPIKYL